MLFVYTFMKKLLINIGILAGLLTSLFSVWFFLDDRYAHATDVQQIQQSIQQLDKRLEQKIIQDQLDYKQKRVYEIQDRYENKKLSDEIKQELFDLKNEIEKLKDQLKNQNNK
jgi:peptidoglycan hydrolase CwlO-like protein